MLSFVASKPGVKVLVGVWMKIQLVYADVQQKNIFYVTRQLATDIVLHFALIHLHNCLKIRAKMDNNMLTIISYWASKE